MQITIETGTIELIPIDKNGKHIYQAARTYLYPKDKNILNLGVEGKIALCFIDGMEIYHFRKEVKDVEVTIHPNPVKVHTPIRQMNIPYDELYKMYKQSIEDQKVLSEELCHKRKEGK